MVPENKIYADVTAVLLALVLLIVIAAMYGKQAVEWILVHLFGLFIDKS